VISELERLIPTKWIWKVEEIESNMFQTIFPTIAELQRMVEWGVVQSNFDNAKLKIEDKMVDNKAIKVLPKVWVQFNGLTKGLCDFLIIWVVASIIGITKDVDMVFTRKYEICRMQVLVLDPNLIPQFVYVAIGDSLYTLQFRVEENMTDNEPIPMDMDDYQDEDFQQDEDLENG
jgi:hypothetical protein